MTDPTPIEVRLESSSRRERATAALAALYRAELSAKETYTVALCHRSLARYTDILVERRRVHADHLGALFDRLCDLGATPPKYSGAWGTLTRIFEDASASIGAEIAITVLVEGEESLTREYASAVAYVDDLSARLIADRLLPDQVTGLQMIRAAHDDAGA